MNVLLLSASLNQSAKEWFDLLGHKVLKKWITSVSIIKTWFCKDFVIEDQFSVPNSSSSFYSLTCSSI